MTGEFHKGFGEYQDTSDPAISQALQFIDTIAFDMQIDHDANAIEHKALLDQKRYDLELEKDASSIADMLNAIIHKFTRGYSYKDKGFDNTFATPEAWLMHRKHFATLQPDTDTCKNYGFTIASDTRIIENKRRHITSAIISQSPIYINGEILFDTFGVVDHTSGIAWSQMTEKGKGFKYTKVGYAKESAFKKTTEIEAPYRIHIVRFHATEQVYKEVQVPSKQEITDIYNPSNKQFIFDPTNFTNYSKPIEVRNLDEISKIYPNTFKEHPDFFANLVAYLSSCKYFIDTDLEKTLKEISTILERYQDS